MEFLLHIVYFLCRHCERRGLQGVLFRRRGGDKKKQYVWCGGRGGVEGFSGAVRARSAKICLMHSLNSGGLRGLLSRLQERPGSRRKKPCSSSPHANTASSAPYHAAGPVRTLKHVTTNNSCHNILYVELRVRPGRTFSLSVSLNCAWLR